MGQLTGRWQQALAGSVAALLLLGVFQLGRAFRSSDSETDPAAQLAQDTSTTTAPATIASPPAEPATTLVTSAPVPPRTTTSFQGTARSVAFEGVVSLDRLALADDATVDATGEVVDSSGRPLGRGQLTAGGAGTTVAATGMSYAGKLLVQRGVVRLQEPGRVQGVDAVTVSAPRLSFRSTASPQAQPTTLRSPVTVRDIFAVEVQGNGARLSRPPAELRLAKGAGRATLSWAGRGSIEAPGHVKLSGQWLGVKATSLAATLRVADLVLQGEATVQQVYVDGSPRLPAAEVGVELVTAPTAAIPAGSRGKFTWAPRNSSDVDMAMTRISPANAQARWVNLALEPLPPMYGGEDKTPPGGDTSGLAKGGTAFFFGAGSAVPINSVILPHTADRRDITFDVPSGTAPGRYQLVLRVEGNFKPVTVTVPFEVRT